MPTIESQLNFECEDRAQLFPDCAPWKFLYSGKCIDQYWISQQYLSRIEGEDVFQFIQTLVADAVDPEANGMIGFFKDVPAQYCP